MEITNTTTTTTGNTGNTGNTDPMERIAASLEKMVRINVKLVEEIRELRREIASLRCSFNEANHIY